MSAEKPVSVEEPGSVGKPVSAGESVVRRDMDDKIPRGLAVRVFVYVVAGHLFAAFVYLLFTVGDKR